MKKALYLTLVPTVLLGLTSCGGGNNDSRRVVTMEFVEAGFGLTPYQKLKEDFEKKNPEIRLSLVPNAQMADTTAVRIANGTASDVMIYDRKVEQIKLWTASNYIEDLTSLFNEECENGKTVKDKLDSNALKASEFDGKYYTIPEYYNINGFVYNASLFASQGWSVPKTTKELKDLCVKINNTTLQGGKKVKPLVYCKSADGYLYYADQGWFTSYEGIKNLDTFYKFESPEVYNPTNNAGKIKALENQKYFFFDSGFQVENSSELTNIVAQNMLLSYDAAMMLNGSWLENEISEYITSSSPELRMFALPEMSDDNNNILRSPTYQGGDKGRVINAEFNANMFIPSKAKNKEDAKTLLKYLCTDAACEIWTKYSNSVKPIKYDYSTSNPAFADMSAFGKSVLEIASSNTIYVALSNSKINIVGGAGYRPLGYWFWKFSDTYTPENCVKSEYDYAVEKWSNWETLVKQTFGN